MTIGAICCFHGRIDHVKRVLKCYMNQDYAEKSFFLLYNNAPVVMELHDFPIPENKAVMLINNYLDRVTGEEYTNVGAIFRDALSYLPSVVDVVTHMDSDDIFLPNHLSNGFRGMKEAYKKGMLAYKPDLSYFIDGNDNIVRVGNNMEPSIFVDADYLRRQNYALEVDPYHQGWLDPLLREGKIYIEKGDKNSTFVYNWERGHNTHKLSGGGNSFENFVNHRRFSIQFGDRILYPAPQYEVQYYYDLVKSLNA